MAARKHRRSFRWRRLRWLAVLVPAFAAVAFGRGQGLQRPRISPFFESAERCEGALRGRPKRRAGVRIGTWNLRWFPRGTAHGRDPQRRTDLRWLACAIASLDVDVLAVQEVLQDPEGRAALLDLGARLDQLTGGRWRGELDACPGSGRQHVGFLYDERRVQLQGAEEVAALNPGRSACDRSLRPGFTAHARFADGSDAHLLTVHLDSGTQARDFGNRRVSVERLREVLPALQQRHPDGDVVVLGDFNTMGCEHCDPQVAAQQELADLDVTLHGLELRRAGGERGPLCSEYYRRRPVLLDHVLVARGAAARWTAATLESFGPCAALACAAPPPGFELAAFERLSDHCPLVLDLPGVAGTASKPAARRATRR